MDRDAWNQLYVGEEPDSGTGTEELFLAVAREFEPGRALDLGCGPGTLSLALAETGWQVTGVDFADAAINLARTAAAGRRLDVTFLVADIAHWSPPEPFDFVVSAYAMPPRGAQRDAALATAIHALAPGGRVVVAEWDRSMADAWSFMKPDDLVSLDEIVSGLEGLTINRADVISVDAHGERARSVFVQAHKPG